MLNLMKKDLILQKYLTVFYFILFVAYLQLEISFIIAVVMTTSLFVMNSHYYDEKDNASQLINSLPYTKREIVLSKYIEAIIVTIVMVVIGVVIQIVRPMQFEITFTTVIGCIIGSMLFTAVYLPIFYRFTQQYLLIIASVGIALIIVYMPKIIDLVLTKFPVQIDYLKNTPDIELYSYLTIFSIAIYILSWFVSLKFYSKRAF